MKRLDRIKSGAFSRGFALARMSMSAGAKAASHAVGNIFASEGEKTERLKELIYSQVGILSKELGELKGSLMKVGQMLSMYGEHLLPPEANALLKSLQSQSPPLEWRAIEPVLRRQLGAEKLALLEIEPDSFASASLGQVHRARVKADGRLVAMKIQYPGVDKAIESDLKALRSILSMSKLIPKGPKYDELFREVQKMLHQEVDYERELQATQEFGTLLSTDSRFVIPAPVPEFCSGRVLTTVFQEGVPVDSPEVAALSVERRNALGLAALELHLTELFRFGKVQTDPHFGNYRVRTGVGGEPDRLVLLDFGAVRRFSKDFLEPYRLMALGALENDSSIFERGASKLGFLLEEDGPELRAMFLEFVRFFLEPFALPGDPQVPGHLLDSSGAYDWGMSDLPKRAVKKGAELALTLKLRPPPREIVFLDRKMAGLFFFQAVLKTRFNSRELLKKYISSPVDLM